MRHAIFSFFIGAPNRKRALNIAPTVSPMMPSSASARAVTSNSAGRNASTRKLPPPMCDHSSFPFLISLRSSRTA